MKTVPYLIIGAGMTGWAAARAIRKIDPNTEITIIGAETHPPYKRPPLSKKLWQGEPLDSVWYKTGGRNVDLILNTRVTSLDPAGKTVTDEHGAQYGYGKLLLATGGTPRKLPFGGDAVQYFRYLDDYLALERETANKQHFTVLGGSFIGSEVAAGLRTRDKDVTMAFMESGISALVFPAGLSQFVTDYYRARGIQVLANETVQGLERDGRRWKVITVSREILTEGVVGGIGILPDIALAEQAGLNVDRAILVNETLQTSQPDIYAAGDAVSIFNSVLKRWTHFEHEDNALKMGEAAGKNMVGQITRYDEYLPFFYSDLFELGYEAVGILSSKLETFEDWQEPYKKGVVYYLEQGKVVGVLLWNVWGQVDAAREVIRATQNDPLSRPEALKGRLPAAGE
jgi:3-phenylpropionate/trans-cinnamate dioxygenase ferredoxin reductase subunit